VGTRIHVQCEIWVVIIGVTEKLNYLHVYYSLPILCHCPTFCDRIIAYTSEVGIARYELRRTTVTPKILSPCCTMRNIIYLVREFAFVRATNKIQYDTGQRRCQMCDIFIKWDGIWCPCCGYRLRTIPRWAIQTLSLINQVMNPIVGVHWSQDYGYF